MSLHKTCRDCKQEKPLSEFYPHPSNSDRHDFFCKPCGSVRNSERSKARREKNGDAVRAREAESERKRFGASRAKPRDEKVIARNKLQSHIQRGMLRKPLRCEECAAFAGVQGHHLDYSRPLFVVWLCTGCHGKRHRKYQPSPSPEAILVVAPDVVESFDDGYRAGLEASAKIAHEEGKAASLKDSKWDDGYRRAAGNIESACRETARALAAGGNEDLS